jgi:hypothetical protein
MPNDKQDDNPDYNLRLQPQMTTLDDKVFIRYICNELSF